MEATKLGNERHSPFTGVGPTVSHDCSGDTSSNPKLFLYYFFQNHHHRSLALLVVSHSHFVLGGVLTNAYFIVCISDVTSL